jgi:hypothetical protein
MQKLEADFQQLLNGTQTEIPATVSVHVDGQLLTQPELVAKLQAYLQVYEQVAATKAAYGQALQALQGIADEAHAFKVAYGQVLRHVLGKASPNLGSFGINVIARKTPTVETQLLAHAKRLATRKARGTLGKRQKLNIKGANVAAITVTEDGVTSLRTIVGKVPG